MTEPLCTCGKRPKHKCSEESGVGGKMCLREYDAQPISLKGLSKVDRDIKQLRKELEEELERYDYFK